MKIKEKILKVQAAVLILTAIFMAVYTYKPEGSVYACPHLDNEGRWYFQSFSADYSTTKISYLFGNYNYIKEVLMEDDKSGGEFIQPIYDAVISEAFELLIMGGYDWINMQGIPSFWESGIENLTVSGKNFDLNIGVKNTSEWVRDNASQTFRQYFYQVYVKRLNDNELKAEDEKVNIINNMIAADGLEMVLPEIIEIETGFNTQNNGYFLKYFGLDRFYDPIDIKIYSPQKIDNAVAVNVYGSGETEKIAAAYDEAAKAYKFRVNEPGTYIVVKDFDTSAVSLPLQDYNISVVEAFRNAHSYALSLTLDNVSISDNSPVYDALIAYNSLGGSALRAKTLLLDDKALIDSLWSKIMEYRFIDDFYNIYGGILSLTEETVSREDKTLINSAIAFLSQDAVWAQTYGWDLDTLLKREKILLNAMLNKITAMDAAAFFSTRRALTLSLKADNVKISDKTAVNSALSDFALLSADAQILLTAEKELLDELLGRIILMEKEINDALYQSGADNFKLSYAPVLSKTLSTVAISDKPAVEEAIGAFEDLDAQIKYLLTEERFLLYNLRSAISDLETGSQPENKLITILIFLGAGISVLAIGLTTVILIRRKKKIPKVG